VTGIFFASFERLDHNGLCVIGMSRIQRLSQGLINKIAAGEVIERPASVAKELVENALDAGARRIDVSVRSGGSESIRVVDDGCGIPADELPLAVASHATSKITSSDDLFRVQTLGFRGEALASIAEVSRLTIRSRTPEAESGAELEVVGGVPGETMPCGCPVGTQIEVQNLFFNTPVRRKFLRTTSTEFGHISEAVTRLALAAPGVHFSLRHNDRPVYDLPGGTGLLDRIGRFIGRDVAEKMIWVENADGPVRISGYVGHPEHTRSNNKLQYLLLNGRHIRDRSLQHALGEAYRGLIMTGRYPIAVLWIEMPAEMVDVNVHPTKLEVRFQESGRLYSQLLSALRTRFLSTDLTTRVQSDEADDEAAAAHDQQRAAQMRQELVDWAKGEAESWSVSSESQSNRTSEILAGLQALRQRSGPLELNTLEKPWAPANRHAPQSEAAPAAGLGQSEGRRDTESSPAAGAAPDQALPSLGAGGPRAMQIHNRYLITESDDGVMVVDQHALHERILYEELRQRVNRGQLETQRLLVPEPVDLSPSESACVLENGELLGRLGVSVEAFGGDTVLVSGYPAMLANMSPAEVLRALVERLLAGGTSPEQSELLDDLLHTVACKAAIKAGDRLSPAEVEALLEKRHLIDNAHHCPHGRPTALVFTREALDKQFRRV
jgi:DNA mismatch repair protein MutL